MVGDGSYAGGGRRRVDEEAEKASMEHLVKEYAGKNIIGEEGDLNYGPGPSSVSFRWRGRRALLKPVYRRTPKKVITSIGKQNLIF
jgi:hypothetical protein